MDVLDERGLVVKEYINATLMDVSWCLERRAQGWGEGACRLVGWFMVRGVLKSWSLERQGWGEGVCKLVYMGYVRRMLTCLVSGIVPVCRYGYR